MNKSQLIFWSLLAILLLAGCVDGLPALNRQQTATIGTGNYIRITPQGVQPTPMALAVIGAEIDREQGTVAFNLLDGATVTAMLTKDRLPKWAIGCPTNLSSTRMEVLHLAEESLTLDDETFEEPMLIANCPVSPAIFVLREAAGGNPDYTAAACEWWAGAKCLFFGREYITVHGEIIDADSKALIPEAEVAFALPWGATTVPGDFTIILPGNSVIVFTVSAPGYVTAGSTIEIYLLHAHNRTEQQVFVMHPRQAGDAVETGERLEFSDPDTPVEFRWELRRKP